MKEMNIQNCESFRISVSSRPYIYSLFFNLGKYNRKIIAHKYQNTYVKVLSIEINTTMINFVKFDSSLSWFILKVN